MQSFIKYASDSDFSIYNIPFGIAQIKGKEKHVVSRIGNFIIDLAAMHSLGLIEVPGLHIDALRNEFLNEFIGLGKELTTAVRQQIQARLRVEEEPIWGDRKEAVLIPAAEVEMCMPLMVGNYTDFYSSEYHAYNVGCMFRDPENALMPNWKHLPVGYHGRASSIICSDRSIHRPSGQMLDADKNVVFGPSKRLDFELEMAFVVGKSNALGHSVATQDAPDHIFGLMLFNDWSARDIQAWEYVPLGPFLGKSFASTVSPWIVTLEALAPFRIEGPKQDPKPLPYLQFEYSSHYDIQLEVYLKSEGFDSYCISKSNYKFLYWNIAQQLAHHTVNGCNLQVGDLCASGTISGPEKSSYGSFLELSWAGREPMEMPDGSKRSFLLDGDELCLRGFGTTDGQRVGFGEARTKILPAL